MRIRDPYVCTTVRCNNLAGVYVVAWGSESEDDPLCDEHAAEFAGYHGGGMVMSRAAVSA